MYPQLALSSIEQDWWGSSFELRNLAPTPIEEWRRTLTFLGLGNEDKLAMSRSVEALMHRAVELVIQTYNHLQQFPETAAILGWEENIDQEHLEERRRFFTIWLARTLGIDTSDEFATYLFRAGKFHAGHGPRQIHTPPTYVTAAMGSVLAFFAQALGEAGLKAQDIAAAMAGWSKYLNAQLNLMLLGYQIAREFEAGEYPIRVKLFGTVRPIIGKSEVIVRVYSGDTAAKVLGKLFSYYPDARSHALVTIWDTEEKSHSEWLEVVPVYVFRKGWRILLNGRDLSYGYGHEHPIAPQDEIAIFPPGR
ncbi:MAG: protoglobin domain-containing protein [Anaerolineales bacterium]|nr:protoglobin domain-containing protein [Anaerolineales bacterium]